MAYGACTQSFGVFYPLTRFQITAKTHAHILFSCLQNNAVSLPFYTIHSSFLDSHIKQVGKHGQLIMISDQWLQLEQTSNTNHVPKGQLSMGHGKQGSIETTCIHMQITLR